MLKGIKIYQPNDILKNYIDYYYELTLEDVSYYAYPHYNLPVSLISNVKISLVNDIVRIEKDSTTDIQSFTINKITKPIKVKFNGKINSFCIVFKPYGLSQFINDPLDLNSKKNLSIIKPFTDLSQNISDFPKLETTNKVNHLESYLLSKLNIKEDLKIVTKCFNLFSSDNKLSIDQIAEHCKCHSKKLYRIFKRTCGDSPIVFKKIVQFRKALEKIKNENDENLTNIALNSNYFDQPAFNKAFKNLTGEKPTSFFKEVESSTLKKIYFKNS